MTQTNQEQATKETNRFDITQFFRKVSVLDVGHVELIDGMVNDPLLKIVNAARVSFHKESLDLTAKDEKLIKFLHEHKHYSTFRHSFFSFRIKAPLFVFKQLWKHQIGVEWIEDDNFTGVGDITLPSTSWNEVSGRYVEFEPEFYIPEIMRKQSKDNKQGSEGDVGDVMINIGVTHRNLISPKQYLTKVCADQYRAYKVLIEAGVAKELARFVLPQNLYSECMVTLSLQAILYMFEMRDKTDAQLEAQRVVQGMKCLILPIFRGVIG